MNKGKTRRFRIVVAISVVLGVLIVTPVVSVGVAFFKERNRCERRLVHLLAETDWQALLDACRELSRHTAAGELKRTSYHLHSGLPLPWFVPYHRDPEAASLPPQILDVDPLGVYAEGGGQVLLMLWPVPRESVVAYPENYMDRDGYMGAVELIPGLYFSEEHYGPNHPDLMEYINKLVEKGREFQHNKAKGKLEGDGNRGQPVRHEGVEDQRMRDPSKEFSVHLGGNNGGITGGITGTITGTASNYDRGAQLFRHGVGLLQL